MPIFWNLTKNKYNMENKERLSDLYFWRTDATEDEINEAIQASIQKQIEQAFKNLYPKTE